MTRFAILTPTLTSADAVSNDVLMMRRVLSERGHEVHIFAENSSLAGEQIEAPAAALKYLRANDDVLIYHHSIGCASGDAAQTQQQLVTLRGWHHADQLGLTQPGSGRCEIQLAEPNETVDSFVERAITDCAERGQQTGSGVMDPQAGQIYDELRRRLRAD